VTAKKEVRTAQRQLEGTEGAPELQYAPAGKRRGSVECDHKVQRSV
jgi:hypothetical protein